MLKVKINLPNDMTEVYKIIGDFQADIIIKECQKNNVNVESLIKHLENKQ